MKVKKRYILLGLAVVICIWIFGCMGKSKTPDPRNTATTTKPEPSATVIPPVIINGTDYTITFPSTGQGPSVWIASAKSLTANSETKKSEMLDVACQLYQNGVLAATVTADSASAEMIGDNTVHANIFCNVRAKAEAEGLYLEADSFYWESEKNKVTAENVHWVGKGFDMRADHGTFTTDLVEAKFSGNVRTTYAGGAGQ